MYDVLQIYIFYIESLFFGLKKIYDMTQQNYSVNMPKFNNNFQIFLSFGFI